MRGDPVPVHEQVRAQRRAVAAGVVLGVLGLVGALVVGGRRSASGVAAQDLVVGRPSGALYVVAHDPDRLVPVANAVAGRLVLAALRSAAGAHGPGTRRRRGARRRAADPGGRRRRARWAADPQRRARAALGGVRRGRRPRDRLVGTTVLAGSAARSGGAGRRRCSRCPVAAPGWSPAGIGTGSTSATPRCAPRSGSPAGSPARVARPGLGPARGAAAGDARSCRGAGAAGPARRAGRVGDVLVSRPAGAAPRYHVVLDGGPAGGRRRWRRTCWPRRPAGRSTRSGRRSSRTCPRCAALDLAGWPAAAPRLREPAEAPATCWTWSGEPGADPAGGVHVGPDAERRSARRARRGGRRRATGLDAVAVGAGGAVRATAPGVPVGAGTVWVVSGERGRARGARTSAIGGGARDRRPRAGSGGRAAAAAHRGRCWTSAGRDRAVDVAAGGLAARRRGQAAAACRLGRGARRGAARRRRAVTASRSGERGERPRRGRRVPATRARASTAVRAGRPARASTRRLGGQRGDGVDDPGADRVVAPGGRAPGGRR